MNRKFNYSISILFASIFLLLLILLSAAFFAYRSFLHESDVLRQLQDEYRAYISVLKTVAKDARLSEEEIQQPAEEKKKSFSVVDRRRAYLKNSLQKYLAEKDAAIDAHEIEKLYATYHQPIKKIGKRQARSSARGYVGKRMRKKVFSAAAQQLPVLSCQKVTDFTLSWPIERDKFWISSFFGPRRKANGSWGYHYGIDLASVKGNPVLAAADGHIIEAGYVNGYGNTVVIVHNQKYKTRYAHLQTIRVRVGQDVSVGQLIGTVGDTGHIRRKGRDGSHLHFEVYSFGRQINPLTVLA